MTDRYGMYAQVDYDSAILDPDDLSWILSGFSSEGLGSANVRDCFQECLIKRQQLFFQNPISNGTGFSFLKCGGYYEGNW